jgi:hypothetical protein
MTITNIGLFAKVLSSYCISARKDRYLGTGTRVLAYIVLNIKTKFWNWTALMLRIMIRIGSGFNQVSGSGSVIEILIRKSRKKLRNFKFHVLRAEDFFCNLDVLYGGLG